VVEEEMARHQDPAAFLGELVQLLHLGPAHRRRLLDEHVLVHFECPPGELVVGRDRRRHDNRVDRVVGEQVVEVGRHASGRVVGRERRSLPRVDVAEPAKVGQLAKVPHEVVPPLAQTGDADGRGARRARHSLKTFPFWEPFLPVALRRSTTSSAPSTTSS
jgi:hypothetical protein